MIKIFLTGNPGVGKTTTVLRINNYLKFRGYKTGGFITIEEREGGRRVGFKIIDLLSLQEDWLAHVSFKSGPSIGRYRVNLSAMKSIGVNAIKRAISEVDVILIDEVGPMEMFSEEFKGVLSDVMKCDKPVILTVHRSYINKDIPELHTPYENITFHISTTNREAMPLIVSREIIKRLKK